MRMKLYYDKRLSDPTYYAQVGIRNGKKVSSKNIKNFGKHSELLKTTDDPLAYVKEEIRKMNEEYRVGKVSYTITADFNERVKYSDESASSSNWLNIGYFFLQDFMSKLKLADFFKDKQWIERFLLTVIPFTVSLPTPESLTRSPSMPHGIGSVPITKSRTLITSIFCGLWIS